MPLSLRAEYELLAQIARQLRSHADDVRTELMHIQYHVGRLEEGGWLGEAADRFYEELNSLVLPYLKRLETEIEQTGEDTGKLVPLFQQTNELIQTYFGGGGFSAAGPGAGGDSAFKFFNPADAGSKVHKVDGFALKQQSVVSDSSLKQAGDPDTEQGSNYKFTNAWPSKIEIGGVPADQLPSQDADSSFKFRDAGGSKFDSAADSGGKAGGADSAFKFRDDSGGKAGGADSAFKFRDDSGGKAGGADSSFKFRDDSGGKAGGADSAFKFRDDSGGAQDAD